MAKRKRGHPTVFSAPQNQALRVELARQIARFGSQRATAEELGIQQQNVARLVNERRAGFAYSTATMLARLAGFAGVDAFFRERGVLADSGTDVTAPQRAAG
jgi:hypothetical protein